MSPLYLTVHDQLWRDISNAVEGDPLDADGRYQAGRAPYLAWIRWGGIVGYAEFLYDAEDRRNAFVDWCDMSGAEDEISTDFLTVPVRVGALVQIGDDTFVVRAIEPA